MRARFFSIILILLLLVSAAAVKLNALFVRNERIKLIDQQVRATALNLVDSEIAQIRKVNFEEMEKILAEELGESRIGKFFVLRDQDGKVLFESSSARGLPIYDFPQTPQWVTIRKNSKYIRVLNLQFVHIKDRTLQVGLMLDENLTEPSLLGMRSLILFSVILLLGLGVAWISTDLLLRPINELSRFVTGAAEKTSEALQVPEPPASLAHNATLFGRPLPDEFSRLITGLSELIQKINRNYKLSRFWTFQLAHELKTPLSILSVEIENAEASGEIKSSVSTSLKNELGRASEVVSSFLSWAELEHSNPSQMLYANKLSRVLASITERSQSQFPARLIIAQENDIEVLAHPAHLEQVLLNLIMNALTYSPAESKVEVVLAEDKIRIRDQGPGIPDLVLTRLGEPFNRGPNSKVKGVGHGLGLAWVASVTKLYGWQFKIERVDERTEVSLTFPKV